MLALSRKLNQSIIVNDNIEITVLEIKGDQIKIGIDAPKAVPIYRKEIYTQIKDSNAEAMSTATPEVLSQLANFSGKG